ncbi:Levodione [Cyphellophora attinorum]|uniref:Levodione n=1 Tax=Cyphellophora attinorum TaxID=1664694 RepID=A0A0N1GZQ5_9EURO|nr:Levodione [Phialophora attinorum]KPI36642.1 Levodione [Phialophora attinorum]
MASLKDKVIAITGAAGGIGAATAHVLASRGAYLSLADTDAAELQHLSEEISKNYKTEVLATTVDVTNSDQVDEWVAATVKHFSKLSGGVNLAGIVGTEFGRKGAHEVSDQDFDLVMKINVKGVMACQRAQLQHIEDGGSIVNAASVSGKMGIPQALSYVASKHAVIGLTRVAAVENGHRRVRVNAIAPGSVDTKMLDAAREVHIGDSDHKSPINRIGKAEEVGALIAFLLSDEASFTTGAVYTIDGGLTP